MARRLWNEFVEGREEVNLKKYLYILRPAMCLAWIREQPAAIPPMSLPQLMSGISLSQPFRDAVTKLLTRKAQSSEVGNGPRVGALDTFIRHELTWAATQDIQAGTDDGLRAEAEAMFRNFVRRDR